MKLKVQHNPCKVIILELLSKKISNNAKYVKCPSCDRENMAGWNCTNPFLNAAQPSMSKPNENSESFNIQVFF